MNPQGKVPALRFEGGDLLTEAAAILTWLRPEYGSGAIARNTRVGRKEAEALAGPDSDYMTGQAPMIDGGLVYR